jgi:two-component system KDP operon response regulator KdpE
VPFDHLAAPVLHAPARGARPVVLCVEDDETQLAHLGEHLDAAGYDVTTATSAKATYLALAEAVPHAILLDLGLPDVDGVDLCRRLVAWPGCPVIVVSAERFEERMIAALDAGARDYVTKPYSAPLLEARLRAALRDTDPARRAIVGEVLVAGDVVLDSGAHELAIDDEPVHLHARGFAVLEMLMRNAGQLLPYAVLVGKRRGEPVTEAETQALRIVISRVRKVLGTGPRRPQIVTEARIGYRLVGPEPG